MSTVGKHPLLRRQTRRRLTDATPLTSELLRLLGDVDGAYQQADDERRLLERSLELASEELLESRRDLTEALRASGVSVWSWSAAEDEAVIEGFPNPMRPERSGRSSSGATQFFEPIVDAEGVRAAMELALATGSGFEMTFAVRTSDERTRWLRACGRPHPDSHGLRLVGTCQDVTEQVEAESQVRLRAPNSHAPVWPTRMEWLGTQTGVIAHELIDLLTPLASRVDELLGQDAGDARASAANDAVRRTVERAVMLAGRLLALSPCEPPELATVDLNVELCELVRRLRPLVPDVEVEMNLAPSLGRVFADRKQLRQAFLFLSLQARETLAPGGLVTVSTCDEGVDVVVHLRRELDGSPLGDIETTTREVGCEIGREASSAFGIAAAVQVLEQQGGTLLVAANEIEIRFPRAAP